MAEKNVAEYLKEFQEEYDLLRETGRNLFYVRGVDTYLFALSDKERETDKRGNLKITQDLLQELKTIFTPIEAETLAHRGIEPYNDVRSTHDFDLFGLRKVVSGDCCLLTNSYGIDLC